MGLSASQARYLALTARKNDNEFEAQQINHTRSSIASKMQDISTKYTDGVNNRQLLFLSRVTEGCDVVKTRLNYNIVTAEAPNGLGYRLTDKYGTEVRPNNKNANAIREQAKKDLISAKSNMIFEAETEVDGETVKQPVTGDNFTEIYGNKDAVVNKNGQVVDGNTFKENVAGLSATEFNKYWNDFGFEFASGTPMTNIMYTEDDEQAQIDYEKAMAEADALENTSSIYDDRCLEPEFLEKQLRNGNWTLQKLSDVEVDEQGKQKWVAVNYSGVGQIQDALYVEDDAAISTEYETQMDYYQHKDKQLELQLQRLQTSHSAIQTEMDSVKKVIDKNVESSFKTFG